MKEYRVCFTQYFYYTEVAEDEDEAIALAEDRFRADMRQPVANIGYDDVEVWEENE